MNYHFRYLLTVALLWLFISFDLHAQVVIGSGLAPNKGALLDLKERVDDSSGANSNRGIMLPRVKLKALSELRPEQALFTGDLVHTGLTVFNLTDKPRELLCKGIYTWDGTAWNPLSQKGCFCEYSIIGRDGKEYYVYCDDFQGTQMTASNICKTKTGMAKDSYHLMTEAEYMQIWDRPIKGTTDKAFAAGSYFLNYSEWITTGIIAGSTNNVLGVGFAFPGGSPIGGKITGNNVVRCIKN